MNRKNNIYTVLLPTDMSGLFYDACNSLRADARHDCISRGKNNRSWSIKMYCNKSMNINIGPLKKTKLVIKQEEPKCVVF